MNGFEVEEHPIQCSVFINNGFPLWYVTSCLIVDVVLQPFRVYQFIFFQVHLCVFSFIRRIMDFISKSLKVQQCFYWFRLPMSTGRCQSSVSWSTIKCAQTRINGLPPPEEQSGCYRITAWLSAPAILAGNKQGLWQRHLIHRWAPCNLWCLHILCVSFHIDVEKEPVSQGDNAHRSRTGRH